MTVRPPKVRLPMTGLWTEQGELVATRVRALDHGDVLALLHEGALHFVVATLGKPLRWIAKRDTAAFWETEGRALMTASAGSKGYAASEWSAPGHSPHPIVLLEGKRGGAAGER